jgi:hypothetical protein
VDLSQKSYLDLEIDVNTSPKIAPRVKLVTTLRSDRSFVLFNLSERLKTHLGESAVDSPNEIKEKIWSSPSAEDFVKSRIEDMPHLMFSFINLDPQWEIQKQSELPHEHTRVDRIQKALFLIDR